MAYRHKERQEKIKSRKDRVVQAVQTEERRLEQLSALAASVPYYSSIMNLSADIFRTTVARSHDVYEGTDPNLADFQCGLGKLRSFTNEKVFSDRRFRLGHALHEAGVAQSSYARTAVKSLVPRQVERTTGIEPF